jgi:hypothetical protein
VPVSNANTQNLLPETQRLSIPTQLLPISNRGGKKKNPTKRRKSKNNRTRKNR